MPYIPPDNVTAPKKHWQIDCIIYDGGEEEISVSLGKWDGIQVIGIRWNGTEDNNLGNPQSKSHPTWFILPRELGVTVVKDLIIKQSAGNPSIHAASLSRAVNWLRNEGKITDQL